VPSPPVLARGRSKRAGGEPEEGRLVPRKGDRRRGNQRRALAAAWLARESKRGREHGEREE
jgi:hypothetical protein